MKQVNTKWTKKEKIFTVFGILLIILTILATASIAVKYRNGFTIMQLSPKTDTQMMGYIIKTRSHKIIVIDGGMKEDGKNLENQLRKLGGHVDAWFVTHHHGDHTGALAYIIDQTNISIDHIYASLNDREWIKKYDDKRFEQYVYFEKALQNDRVKGRLVELQENQILTLDNLKVKILGIKNPEITKNAGNNSSVVMKFFVNNRSLLILGDTGLESSKKLLEKHKNELKSDVVQMSHHGQSGVPKELYEQVKPKICLWPTPEWLWNNDNGGGYNSGNWKTLETRAWMQELGVKRNIVAKEGDITIRIW